MLPIAPVCSQALVERPQPLGPNPSLDIAGHVAGRLLGILSHNQSELGQAQQLVPAILRIVVEPNDPLLHHLPDCRVDCLARNSKTSGDIRGSPRSRDNADHNHRLSPTDLRPTLLPEVPLQFLIHPAESLEE